MGQHGGLRRPAGRARGLVGDPAQDGLDELGDRHLARAEQQPDVVDAPLRVRLVGGRVSRALRSASRPVNRAPPGSAKTADGSSGDASNSNASTRPSGRETTATV
ncbi:hypothetical protein [Dactylosporangium darangshiense]|uniref:hypothetical protein n=1 Tax=Dactylosporangium darangshiense TaxID=579108 RepID=UPI0036335927